jgi:Leucine-rich repeat (LRR) protein
MIFVICLLWLWMALRCGVSAGGGDCIAYEPCVCESKPKRQLVNDLLGEGLMNEANLKLFQQQSNVINCSLQGVKSIPKFKLLGYTNQPTIDCLDLSKNQLEVISDSNFYGLILVCIDFSDNRISLMSRNAFKGLLNSLAVIKAANNQMHSDATFPAYFLSKLNRLQVLDLAGNRLDKIVDRSFQTMSTPTLKYLDMHLNTLDCIYDDAFEGCSSLVYLNLCNNRLGSVVDDANNCTRTTSVDFYFLKHLPALENLQLCSNEITKINGGLQNFKSNDQLRILNLENNLLSSIGQLFCDNKKQADYLRNLQTLNLASNKLTHLNQHDLGCLFNLQELYLNSNKLNTIGVGTFKKLGHLKLLTLNDNSDLGQSPSMLDGLEGSLRHLTINFRNSEEEAERESSEVGEYKFDKLIDYLIVSNRLRLLETIDLSGSRFHRGVYVNVASLLLTSNSLKTIKCHNCSIKYLKYKYELSENQHFLPENVEQMETNEFDKYYKMYACYRELNERVITIDLGGLNQSTMGSCEWSSMSFRDEIDVNFNYNLSNCFNKRIYFIQQLARFIRVANFYCSLKESKKKVDWNEFNLEKFATYTATHSCPRFNIKCEHFYKKTKSGEWKSMLNGAPAPPPSFALDRRLIICLHLIFLKLF